MSDTPEERVPLAAAVAALRQELLQVWMDPSSKKLLFKVAPVELTLQVAVTSAGKGSAGIKWWLINAGAEMSRERTTTQTVKLTLDPVTLDSDGNPVSVFIDSADETAKSMAPADVLDAADD